jgi:hypothetical protein
MDDQKRHAEDAPDTIPSISRRALFGRTALLAAGAAATLLGLTACPGGDGDDDDDDEDDD